MPEVASRSNRLEQSNSSSAVIPMKGADRIPFVAWPGWTHARYAAQLIALVGAWFCLVFVGADWLTAHRTTRVRVHLDAELRLPLVPVFLIAYMSIYLLFLAVPFVLRTRRRGSLRSRPRNSFHHSGCRSWLSPDSGTVGVRSTRRSWRTGTVASLRRPARTSITISCPRSTWR